jgi:hypothetical protein
MDASARLTPFWRIHREQHTELPVDGHGQRINAKGRHPRSFVLVLGRQHDFTLAGGGAGAGNLEGQGGGRFDAFPRKIVGGGEAPAAKRQYANSKPQGFGAGDVPGLAVLGADLAIANLDGAHIGVRHPAPGYHVKRL